VIRKQVLLNCIKKNRSHITEIDEKYLLNASLRIWSGCLGTAKTLSLRTQSSINTKENRQSDFADIDVTASKDTLYRHGEEIACLWEPNPDNICFDGVPGNSYARKYERDWSERKGKRQERKFDY
jgi:hypothetical protein